MSMLVLTRKRGEAIQIGDDIEVKIISIEGEQIKIGIHAPDSIDIHRQEVYQAIQEQNKEAAQLSVDILQLLKKDDDFLSDT